LRRIIKAGTVMNERKRKAKRQKTQNMIRRGKKENDGKREEVRGGRAITSWTVFGALSARVRLACRVALRRLS